MYSLDSLTAKAPSLFSMLADLLRSLLFMFPASCFLDTVIICVCHRLPQLSWYLTLPPCPHSFTPFALSFLPLVILLLSLAVPTPVVRFRLASMGRQTPAVVIFVLVFSLPATPPPLLPLSPLIVFATLLGTCKATVKKIELKKCRKDANRAMA